MAKPKKKPEPKKPTTPRRARAKPESASNTKWKHAGVGILEPQEYLGQRILFDLNPYKDASEATDFGIRKLGAGKGNSANDAEFWLDLIQTEYPPTALPGGPVTWRHAGEDIPIRKSVRLPYLIRDREKRLILDHLLIGYTVPTNTPARKLASGWGAADPANDVGFLGQLMMKTLYPTLDPPFGVSWPRYEWSSSPENEFVPDPNSMTAYDVSRRYWKFRNLDHRVEKSVVVKYAAIVDGADDADAVLGRLVIGYEGGGGW